MDEQSESQSVVSPSSKRSMLERPMSRRKFLSTLAEGAVGGVSVWGLGELGRYFIPEADASIQVAKNLMGCPKKMSFEDEINQQQAEIENVYRINVEFPEEITPLRRAFILEKLGQTLSIYPPQLFHNLATVASQKVRAGLDFDIVAPPESGIPFVFSPSEDLLRKGWTFSFRKLSPLVGGIGSDEGISINSSYPEPLGFFRELFAHELGHTIHSLFGEPGLTSFTADLGLDFFNSNSLEGFSHVATDLPRRLLLPGFVSVYSRFDAYEDAAETFSLLLSNPRKALNILNNSEYQGELKLKLIAAMDMLYCFSGGLMDKQYYLDLAKGKVDGQYWQTKQAEPYVFGSVNESTVLFVTDIDKSSRRLPTLIEITEIEEGEGSLSQFNEYPLGSLEGRSVALENVSCPSGSWINLVVDGVPLNFLAPKEGRRLVVKLTSLSGKILFEVENNNGLFLVGKVETEEVKNPPEFVLKTAGLLRKVNKALGFVVLGSQAMELAEEAASSHIPPSRRKRLTAEALISDKVTRRDFLRRFAALAALSGVEYLFSTF